MAITANDFFVVKTVRGQWGGQVAGDQGDLDHDRLTALIAAPDPSESDVDVSLALMDLIRDDLLKSQRRTFHVRRAQAANSASDPCPDR